MAKKSPGLRQSMSDLHIWSGLLVGWILYAVFLTGTLAFFRDEITLYMRPELPAAQAPVDAPLLAQQMLDRVLESPQPAPALVSLMMPHGRNPTVSVMTRAADAGPQGRSGFSTTRHDPATGAALTARDTRGGDFFYLFHFNLHYMPALWARWLIGLCAMFMLVAMVSGVITHKKIFTDFFTFRWGKGQRAWLDAHNALSVLGLPFHFMITWSGLVTLMMLYMPWAVDAAFQTPQERQQFQAEMRAFVAPVRPRGEAAPLASLQGMVQQAQQHWATPHIASVTVHHPGDANARVVMTRGEQGRVSTSPRFMVFDGTNAALLYRKDGVGAAAETRGVLYGLHLGRFADSVTRWLYFLVSLAGTAMVGTGLVLWTVKRRASVAATIRCRRLCAAIGSKREVQAAAQTGRLGKDGNAAIRFEGQRRPASDGGRDTRLPDPAKPHLGFVVVERLNIATMAGLSVAVAAFFWCNRLLPLGMADRAQWEIHGFFIAWAGALAWSLLRPAKRAWVELLVCAAILLLALPWLNGLTTERHLLHSLRQGDWVFAGFDLTVLAFAALHFHLAVRTLRHQPKAKKERRPMAAPATTLPTVEQP